LGSASELARQSRHPSASFQIHDEPAPAPIRPAATPPLASLRIRALGERYHGWPYFEIYNLSNKGITSISVVAYGYDAAGQQVARSDDKTSSGPPTGRSRP
jgi:hypothetical protein